MKLGELFQGIVENTIPSIDYIDIVEEIGNKRNGVTKEFLNHTLSDFSFYLQKYVDLILEKRKSDSELIEGYKVNIENNEWKNFHVIQEYYSDADLTEWQKDSIMRFLWIIYENIERAEYLASDKVTLGDSIGDSYRKGIPGSFFWDVHSKNLSDLEIYSRVKEITDGFEPNKINLLCKDFDIFFHWEMDLWLGEFSQEEIQNKINEYEEAGKELPRMGMGDQGGMGISDYFKSDRIIQKKKQLTEDQKKLQEERIKEMAEGIKTMLNVRKLMDPLGFEFYSLYQLRNLLIQLKAEHTSAELRPKFHSKFDSSNSKQKSLESYNKPIHWLKGTEALKQFLDNIKSEGLIEIRDTEEIIQEHFFVDGQAPIKESQSIKWLIENQYLTYLMHRLAEEFIINIKGKKHQLTASHFISSSDKSLNTHSLASQLSGLLRHGKSSDKSLSKIENIIQKVKS